MFDQFQIIAQRGWPIKYPENTILGFDKAIEAGATMLEFDVQITQDDRLIIFHENGADYESNACQSWSQELTIME